jgi:TonB family protein
MLKNIYLKGLILSLGLHATVLSFFYFNNNNFKKSESSMTEVIIVSSDESIPSDEKSDYQKKIKVTSVDQKKIHDVKKKFNKPILESEIKLKNKNNSSQQKATIKPNALKKENHSENNESKNIFNELQVHEEFTSKTTKNILSKSASKKIFQSSASYRIGLENNPHPSYPLLARKKGWEGRVIIQANIDKKGNVKFIKVSESSGFKILDEVSVETLKTWKFKPAMLGSKFVDDTVYIPVKFVLKN